MSMPVNPNSEPSQTTTLRETRNRPEERSLGELFSDLSRETSELVREEVDLAKTELTEKATQVGKDVGFLAAGALVLYVGFLAMVAAVILAVWQLGVTPWLAALLVGLVIAGIGAYLVYRGLNQLKSVSLAPRQTLDTLKGDAQWTKRQVT